MALTPKISPLNKDASGKGVGYAPFGRWKLGIGLLAFTAADTYATGGFSIINGASLGSIAGVIGTLPGALENGLGIRTIEDLEFLGSSTTGTGNLSGELYATYDYTTKKVKLWQIGRCTDNTQAAVDTEVTNGALLTGVTLQFIVIGT